LILSNPKLYNIDKKVFKYLDDPKLKINTCDISYLDIAHKKLKKFSKGDFQTDVDISKKTSANLSMNKNNLIQ